MQITKSKIAKLWVLAKKLNWDTFDLHKFVLDETGKASIRRLSCAEANRCLEKLEKVLADFGIPNIPGNRVKGATRGIILKYKYLLGWQDAYFWAFVRRVIGHDLPVLGSDFVRFNWMTRNEGWKLVEALKSVYRRQQKKEAET